MSEDGSRDGEEGVEENRHADAAEPHEDYANETDEEKDDAKLIARPREVLDLEGEHGDLADEESAEYGDEDDCGDGGEELREEILIGWEHPEEGGREETGGCRGEAEEALGLSGVDIELGEAETCEDGKYERSDDEDHLPALHIEDWCGEAARDEPAHIGGVDGGRSETERDIVSEGVELLAHRAANTERAGSETVEEVEYGATDDEESGSLEETLESAERRDDTAEEVHRRDGVRDVWFDRESHCRLGVFGNKT